MVVAPQHWLSLARLVAGMLAWRFVRHGELSEAIFPLVALACILDAADGRLARARGTEGPVGRVLDNLCDFGFLALFFHAAAVAALWTDPVAGVAAGWCQRANELPLLALTSAFGTYALRAVVSFARAVPLSPSPIGHAAGVLNYVLALIGAAVLSLDWNRQSPYVESAMLLVAFANLAACIQNLRLLVSPRSVT